MPETPYYGVHFVMQEEISAILSGTKYLKGGCGANDITPQSSLMLFGLSSGFCFSKLSLS